MGKVILLLAVFLAGYIWGAEVLSFAVDVWQDTTEAARPKFEEIMQFTKKSSNS